MWILLWFARVVHTLSAAIWVGGSVMYLVIVQPALRLAGPAPEVAARIANLFKQMVNICVGALLLSGVYLMFDRLTQTTLGLPYLIVLAVKIVFALILFMLAIYLGQSNIRRLAKRKSRLSQVAPQLMLVFGILVFILGALLNILYEATIAPH
jgi:putative copper export protein